VEIQLPGSSLLDADGIGNPPGDDYDSGLVEPPGELID
jgi:hypothetical protein